jgi:hypothetical protein
MTGPFLLQKASENSVTFKKGYLGQPGRQEAGHTERRHCARRGRLSPRKPKVVPDAAHPGMWRVRWPDGRLSDMTNLTRAKDAVACFMETEERRQRRRHSPSEGRMCVKTDAGTARRFE